VYDVATHKIIMKDEDMNANVDSHWDQSMGDVDNRQVCSDDEDDDNQGLVIDIGRIVLDAVDQKRIMDNNSIASMKSTAEARMCTPKGWEDLESKDMIMKHGETASTTTPSTLYTQEFDVDNMSKDDLEKFVQKTAAKLKAKTNSATPMLDVGVGA
jgi:hypothetical protein